MTNRGLVIFLSLLAFPMEAGAYPTRVSDTFKCKLSFENLFGDVVSKDVVVCAERSAQSPCAHGDWCTEGFVNPSAEFQVDGKTVKVNAAMAYTHTVKSAVAPRLPSVRQYVCENLTVRVEEPGKAPDYVNTFCAPPIMKGWQRVKLSPAGVPAIALRDFQDYKADFNDEKHGTFTVYCSEAETQEEVGCP